MTASSLKPILVFGALLASISQSVCVAKVQQKTIDRILNQLPRTPIYRSYIKTPDGEQQARSKSVDVVTTTAPNGETRHLAKGAISCRLWQNCIIFQDDMGDGHQWECTFDDPGLSKQFGGFESKVLVVGGVENVNHFLENNGADSGKSVLVLSQASIEEGQILVQVDDVIGLIEYNTYDDERVGGLEATLRGSKPMQKKTPPPCLTDRHSEHPRCTRERSR